MHYRSIPFLVAAVLVCLLPSAAVADLSPYSQDFEGLNNEDPSALANDGWLVFGNVFEPDGTTYIRGYGPDPAPNDGSGFSGVVINQGGTEQGFLQLVVYGDYGNVPDQAAGNFVESNVYQEQIIGAVNVGQVWTFDFQVKRGDIALRSTAGAFIKTLDPNAGFELTNSIILDTTNTDVTWQGGRIAIVITPDLEDQILQIGFLALTTEFEPSAVYYDNIAFQQGTPPVDAPPSTGTKFAELWQNYPNPFNPSTKIDFRLEQAGDVEISVYDSAGRRVATLQRGEMHAGEHAVVWDGRTDGGAPVASGQYRYVLKTAEGQVSRSMILLK